MLFHISPYFGLFRVLRSLPSHKNVHLLFKLGNISSSENGKLNNHTIAERFNKCFTQRQGPITEKVLRSSISHCYSEKPETLLVDSSHQYRLLIELQTLIYFHREQKTILIIHKVALLTIDPLFSMHLQSQNTTAAKVESHITQTDSSNKLLP